MVKPASTPFPVPTARDLMIPLDSYPHVLDSATLGDAVKAIVGRQIERKGKFSLPRIVLVFDSSDQLIGLVRRRDLMRGLLPEFLTSAEERHAESHYDFDPGVDIELVALLKDEEQQLLSRNAELPVTKVLQPVSDAVSADDNLLDLVALMVRNEQHVLPVVEDGSVVGVCRTVEILNEVDRLLDP